MECVWLSAFMLFAIPAALYGLHQHQRHLDALRSLAAQTDGLRFQGKEVRGTVQGVTVHVDTYTSGSGKNKSVWTRFRVSDPTSLHAERIATEGMFSGMGKLFTGEDVQVGDPAIDDQLLLRGSEPDIVACMDAEVRPVVRNAVVRGWSHAKGTWTFRRRGKMTNAAEMRAILAHGFEAVTRLRGEEGDVLQQLVQRALTDPVPSAAARALEVRLKDATPLSSEQEEAMLARGGRMAFLIAERMGVRGVPVLYELLRTSSGLTRLRAALALASHGEADVASRSILSAAVTSGTLLPKVLEALAEVGTVEEVPKLTPIADAWTHPQRHAAKKAIRSIQSRIRGAGAGQLSLAESQGGEVSVAEPPSRAGAATRRPQHEG